MSRKAIKIWLSATSILEDDLMHIKAILPNRYKIVIANELVVKAGVNFMLENHLNEMLQCDLFLGIIHPKLSNPIIDENNIYLKEIEKAIEARMPYWYLVHRDVTFSRNLLNDLVIDGDKKTHSKNKYFFDIRTLDIYNHILKQKASDDGFHSHNEFFRLNHLLTSFEESFYKEKKTGFKKLMLASTVYGFEDQLSKIIQELQEMQFHILNSFLGSIKVNPKLSNLENCKQAVDDTDWFMGFIRPYYGTGNINEKNITFEEIKTAISLQKPRWFYIHRDVIFAHRILHKILVKKILNKDDQEKIKQEKIKQEKNILLPNDHIDYEAIELYNFVTKDEEKRLELRNGNWVQEYFTFSEAEIYILSQFSDYKFIDNLLNNKQNGR